MSDYVTTPNYGLYKPVPNADDDVWGDHWNANADTLDTALAAIALTAGVATFNGRTGAVTLSSNDVNAVLPPAAAVPLMDGAATIGTSGHWAQADHVHPSDTSRAPLASPAFTGNPTAPTQATADSSTKLASTAFVQAAAASAGTAAANAAVAPSFNNVGRNLVHNPLFNIQQRGAGPWTTQGGIYTLDRWNLYAATDTFSISAQAITDATRTAIGDEAAQFSLQNVFTGSAASAAYNALYQNVETVRRLSGKTVTLSFWGVATAAGKKLGIVLDQFFGTGGSPSSQVNGTAQTVTLTTTITRYSLTFAIPSASGKTVGTNHDDATTVQICYSSGATNAAHYGNPGVQSGTINIWGVQLEIGSVATPLEKPDPQQDLAKCQRFYQITQTAAQGYGTAGVVVQAAAGLPVAMRAGPTITVVGAPVYTNISTPTCTYGNGVAAIIYYGTVAAAGQYVISAQLTASADL